MLVLEWCVCALHWLRVEGNSREREREGKKCWYMYICIPFIDIYQMYTFRISILQRKMRRLYSNILAFDSQLNEHHWHFIFNINVHYILCIWNGYRMYDVTKKLYLCLYSSKVTWIVFFYYVYVHTYHCHIFKAIFLGENGT